MTSWRCGDGRFGVGVGIPPLHGGMTEVTDQSQTYIPLLPIRVPSFSPPRQAMTTEPQDTDVLYKPIVPGTAESPPKDTIFTLLNEAFPESTTAQQIYLQKVEHRPLSVRPATNEKDAREARRKARLSKLKRKRKPKPLSAKEKRQLRVFEVPKDSVRYDPPTTLQYILKPDYVCRYSDFEKVNALWNQYISEILAYAGPEPTTAACGPVR